eukprot:CAMPEP_0185583180 /NCGR_PEP_ID=MMETSP0434-20130131/21368_1 /TAXON_ID=626734 ORGANISM="Favella taraikaensis, Strain Fe Narragansett Bay" /NCGR_SAMPLE_ID=MMETSP0434 /ASSEMBLY_ACC=CAM_ASM_000379 /LENGTH=102 /DNA_ID=CAMNT_0028202191 /DNA_START=81 /DNA_END=386 /DNA_ORIENTATION=+
MLCEEANLVSVLANLAETSNVGAHSRGSWCGKLEGTASDDLAASLARPDTSDIAGDAGLTAEDADVLGVRGHLNLLQQLTDGSTITGTVLTADAHLLRATSH